MTRYFRSFSHVSWTCGALFLTGRFWGCALPTSYWQTHRVLLANPSGPTGKPIGSYWQTHRVLLTNPSGPTGKPTGSYWQTHRVLLAKPTGSYWQTHRVLLTNPPGPTDKPIGSYWQTHRVFKRMPWFFYLVTANDPFFLKFNKIFGSFFVNITLTKADNVCCTWGAQFFLPDSVFFPLA